MRTMNPYQLVRYSKLLMLAITVMGMFEVFVGTASAQGVTGLCAFVTLYNDVIGLVFIVGIALLVLGGALYAGANLLPGQQKGSLQGYGMGMVIGGVIGIIIAELAPFIISPISGYNLAAISANGVSTLGCATLNGA